MDIRSIACAAALLLGAAGATSPASAGPDDAKWVARCVSDNQDTKIAVSVITAYCTCMNDKMDESETQSITQWEKTHVAERRECDKKSGWR